MAEVIIKLRVMPVSPESDLAKIEQFCREKIAEAGGKLHSITPEEMAFGLKSLTFTFFGDEKTLNPDKIEEAIKTDKHVSSTEVTDVRRALG